MTRPPEDKATAVQKPADDATEPASGGMTPTESGPAEPTTTPEAPAPHSGPTPLRDSEGQPGGPPPGPPPEGGPKGPPPDEGVRANVPPPPERDPSADPRSAIVDPSKVHPVTMEMVGDANKRANTAAPAFTSLDENGAKTSLKQVAGGRPLMFYFINAECPCCVEAEPFVERLVVAYTGKANFAGVIDAAPAKAKSWKEANTASFPLVTDPQKSIIKKYGVKNGVYFVLVRPDLTIERVYPGYSKALLKQMTTALDRLTKQSGTQIETKDAPDRPTSGCSFEG